MVELQSCYFCGTVGDLTEYALLPPGLAANGAEQRSAVLCPTCNRKVKAVLEPFVERLDGDGASDRAARRAARQARRRDDVQRSPPTTDDDTENVDDTDDAEGVTAESTTDDVPTASPETTGVTFDATGDSGSDQDDTPARYRKVVRLLQNREFPMERSALEALVTSAYDLDDETCARIIETAVDRGVLVETDGELRRP